MGFPFVQHNPRQPRRQRTTALTDEGVAALAHLFAEGKSEAHPVA